MRNDGPNTIGGRPEDARDERRAAVGEALDILRQAQRQPLPPLDLQAPSFSARLSRDQTGLRAQPWIGGRSMRIGEDEVSLDKLALLIVFILVGMYGILA